MLFVELGPNPEMVGPDTEQPAPVVSLKSSGDVLGQPGLPRVLPSPQHTLCPENEICPIWLSALKQNIKTALKIKCLCFVLEAVKWIQKSHFWTVGSCRYFACFLPCSSTLSEVLNQVGHFFPPSAPLLPARATKIAYSLLLSKKIITKPADPNSSGTN